MNILTFDIEDWFHILDHAATAQEHQWYDFESRIHVNVERILELLAQKNQQATFFILGWIAQRYPEVVKTIHSFGYEIGCHSNHHGLLYQQSRSEIIADLTTAIKQLEDITGERIDAYRAPGFSLTQNNSWVFEILIEHHIGKDCSIFPASRAHGGFKAFNSDKPCFVEIQGIKIKEFPINSWSFAQMPIIFSGGGYFRLFPYAMIKKLMKKSNYVMTYFHPRDFDPQQPRLKGLSLKRQFKSYYGLSTALPKLEKLIDDFKFIDLKTADQSIDWSQVKTIKL